MRHNGFSFSGRGHAGEGLALCTPVTCPLYPIPSLAPDLCDPVRSVTIGCADCAQEEIMAKPKLTGPRPDWLKVRIKTGDSFARVTAMINDLSLHTVCQEAHCPNIFECWSEGTATFMILGDVCTRHCGFCAVEKGRGKPLD